MTKTALAALGMIGLLGSMGCKPADSLSGPRIHVDSNKGLVVKLVLPKYSYYRGESIPVTGMLSLCGVRRMRRAWRHMKCT